MNHTGSQGHESRMRSQLKPNALHVEASDQTAEYPNRPISPFYMQMGANDAAGESFLTV